MTQHDHSHQHGHEHPDPQDRHHAEHHHHHNHPHRHRTWTPKHTAMTILAILALVAMGVYVAFFGGELWSGR
jgi:hypothetical protein